MDRRTFLKLSGVALGGAATGLLPNALAQETHGTLDLTGPVTLEEVEWVENLNDGMRRVLGVEYSALEPTDLISLKVPEYAENGDKVAMEITVDMPPSELKAIHAFTDINPDPYMHILTMTPQGIAEDPKLESFYLVTVIRMHSDGPVRVVAETNDGRLLVTSKAVNVGSGGCGAPA